MPDAHDLGLMIDSHIPIVVVESREETRALDMMTRLAIARKLTMYGWTVTDGLRRMGFGFDLEQDDNQADPDAVLAHIKKDRSPSLFVLCDFHPYMDDEPKRIRLLKDIAQNHSRVAHTVILLSHQVKIPPEIAHLAARMELTLPTEQQLLALVREEARKWSEANNNQRVSTDSNTLQQLVNNLRGLTLTEARRLARGAIVDDGAITADDLPDINKAKFALMDMDGVLSFEYDTAKFGDVGGLNNLKEWLETRRNAFRKVDEQTLDSPKGIMLLGVQGGGKSLAAKAVAGLWGLPLLRLDFGTLYNKFFGETERNLRQALRQAELMSPCVLWIDEIEKGLGQGSNDQGVSQRVLGTLLTWMAENQHPVFMVATANDIKALPPELMRKGRMDEIFFVDLPDHKVRQVIFRIHLQKRDLPLDSFNLPALASLSDGFSGAEIEQAVVAALYTASGRNVEPSQALLAAEIEQTQPLSVVMSEKVGALRHWAKGRTVPA